MTIVSTYLTFNGNCREAFEFYRRVFGGDFDYVATYADMPEEYSTAPEDKDRVMHVSLKVKDGVIMGSDGPSTERAAEFGNNFSIYVTAASVEETDEFMKNMSENGTVMMPAQNTFWGAYFGMVKDQFGIQWMFSCEASE